MIVLVTSMETLGQTENRYSGIPTIRYAMNEMGLPEPVFCDRRGSFSVVLYNRMDTVGRQEQGQEQGVAQDELDRKGLLEFCRTPRTRSEIIDSLDIASGQYALRRYLDPLVKSGAILLTIPDKPRSPNQKYVTVQE